MIRICFSALLVYFTIEMHLVSWQAHAQAVVLSSGEGAQARIVVGTLFSPGRMVAPRPGDSFTLLHGDRIIHLAAPERLQIQDHGLIETLEFISWRLAEVVQAVRTKKWVREGGGALLPPNIWHIDVSVGGTYCVRLGTAPLLWRSNNTTDIYLQVTDLNNDLDFFLRWKAGEAALDWPAHSSATPSGDYLLVAGPASQSVVTLLAIDETSDLGWIYSLSAMGCDFQLYMLTRGSELALDGTG